MKGFMVDKVEPFLGEYRNYRFVTEGSDINLVPDGIGFEAENTVSYHQIVMIYKNWELAEANIMKFSDREIRDALYSSGFIKSNFFSALQERKIVSIFRALRFPSLELTELQRLLLVMLYNLDLIQAGLLKSSQKWVNQLSLHSVRLVMGVSISFLQGFFVIKFNPFASVVGATFMNRGANMKNKMFSGGCHIDKSVMVECLSKPERVHFVWGETSYVIQPLIIKTVIPSLLQKGHYDEGVVEPEALGSSKYESSWKI